MKEFEFFSNCMQRFFVLVHSFLVALILWCTVGILVKNFVTENHLCQEAPKADLLPVYEREIPQVLP